MRWVQNKFVVWVVLGAFSFQALPARSAAQLELRRGFPTAKQAVNAELHSEPASGALPFRKISGPIGFATSQPDTTEFEFPEDERKHLTRDITVFVIASAFVAYFIIKVFLEGDTDDETEPTKPGKPIPGTN